MLPMQIGSSKAESNFGVDQPVAPSGLTVTSRRCVFDSLRTLSITRPSPGLTLKGPGFYEISGLAWSGNGSIRQVDVSADGGKSWAPAAIQGPVLPKAPVRFRAPWQWTGGPAVLQSRATDDTGMVQPSRQRFVNERGLRGVYHYNAIASWAINEQGEASNVYA